MKKFIALIALSLFSTTLFAGEFPDISIKELQKAIKDGKVAVIGVNGPLLTKRDIFLPQFPSRRMARIWPSTCPRTRTPSWSLIAVAQDAVPISVEPKPPPNSDTKT